MSWITSWEIESLASCFDKVNLRHFASMTDIPEFVKPLKIGQHNYKGLLVVGAVKPLQIGTTNSSSEANNSNFGS